MGIWERGEKQEMRAKGSEKGGNVVGRKKQEVGVMRRDERKVKGSESGKKKTKKKREKRMDWEVEVGQSKRRIDTKRWARR